jgi:hypothetical protein
MSDAVAKEDRLNNTLTRRIEEKTILPFSALRFSFCLATEEGFLIFFVATFDEVRVTWQLLIYYLHNQ